MRGRRGALNERAKETKRKWDSREWEVGARRSRCARVTDGTEPQPQTTPPRPELELKTQSEMLGAPGDDGKGRGSGSLACFPQRELRGRQELREPRWSKRGLGRAVGVSGLEGDLLLAEV